MPGALPFAPAAGGVRLKVRLTPRAAAERILGLAEEAGGGVALKVAVNAGFSDWQHALADGDTVVFVPPVAGG